MRYDGFDTLRRLNLRCRRMDWDWAVEVQGGKWIVSVYKENDSTVGKDFCSVQYLSVAASSAFRWVLSEQRRLRKCA